MKTATQLWKEIKCAPFRFMGMNAFNWSGPMVFPKSSQGLNFTRLHAHIVEEDGAFTVRVRMLNHLDQHQSCWGEEVAQTFDMASSMIGSLASQFSIPQDCISIKIMMRRFKDGTLH